MKGGICIINLFILSSFHPILIYSHPPILPSSLHPFIFSSFHLFILSSFHPFIFSSHPHILLRVQSPINRHHLTVDVGGIVGGKETH